MSCLAAARIKGSAYPLYAFGRASEGAWLPLLGTAAVVAILCALTWLLLSRSFLRVATATGRVGKKVYTERTAQVHSVPRALLGKELSRFTTSPNYMLNCGLGVLLLPILAVLTLIKGGEIGAVKFSAPTPAFCRCFSAPPSAWAFRCAI